MKVGTLLNIGGRLATTTSDSYAKVVRTVADQEMCAAGLDYGTANTFVSVVYNDNGQQGTVNLSTRTWGYA